ncbi:NAD-dependent epimerase/dehydratase family protein [Nakamurella silvestris]|nr:NAD-dependent epimerase/dehydratase family protein [Nakamurella silvestris]
MKVLVIGGSGFIGTRLIRQLLADGHEVTNLDIAPSQEHPQITVIGDVRQFTDVKSAAVGVDAIINLSAQHRDDVKPLSLYEEVNVGGARTVIKAAEANAVNRIVFTSTVAVYGLGKVNPNENSPVEPFNEYGRTKLAAEKLLRAWADGDAQRSLSMVRPSVVFGEANRGNVYNLARQIASGRFVFVGKGRNRKSMAYVGNIAVFLAGRLSAPTGTDITNFADKPDLTTRELVDLVRDSLQGRAKSQLSIPLWLGTIAGYGFDLLAKVTRRNLPISSIRIKKFAAETTVDTGKLQASGFVPAYTLTEALRATVKAEFVDRDGLADPPGGSEGSE